MSEKKSTYYSLAKENKSPGMGSFIIMCMVPKQHRSQQLQFTIIISCLFYEFYFVIDQSRWDQSSFVPFY